MSSVDVTFPGGKRVDAVVGAHVVRTDQPSEHGGEGSAPDPFELFLASLATCTGFYGLAFCQARGIPTAGIRLVLQTACQSGKLDEIRIAIHLPREFPEAYVGAVRTAAASCKVKKMLATPPRITIDAVRSS